MTRFLILAFLLLGLTACGFGKTSTATQQQVSAYDLPKTHPDALTQRHIILSYPDTGEKLDLVYFHDGSYDQAALRRINNLFRDRHDGIIGIIDPELIDYLVDIRTRLGLPPTVVFEILSGFRTQATNRKLAAHNAQVAKESLHMHGWAVDFRISSVDGRAICEIAKTMQRGGVAYYPADNHVHVDLGNIRSWKQK